MIFYSIKNQLKAHPITTFFIVLGLSLSVLMISVGISSINHSQLLEQEQARYQPRHAVSVDITFAKEPNWQHILELFESIDPQTGVILEDVTLPQRDAMMAVTPEYWTKEVVERFPLMQGRYFTIKEVKRGEKVALVGKERMEDVIIEGSEQYLMAGRDKYKVIGIIGVKGKKTRAIDYQVVIPMTSLPADTINKLTSTKQLHFTIHNPVKDTYPDEKIIRNNMEQLFPEAQMDVSPYMSNTMFHVELSERLSLMVMIYLLAIVNAINLTSYWIQERTYEIGIKKAFGYSNYDIVSMLFWEMCLISSISVIIGYTIQLVFNRVIEQWIDYPIDISITHLSTAVLFVVLSAALTIIIPAIKAIKIQPVDVMNRR
ncbi:Macrolide export ATP-binding/permease protein MacB [Geobacillus sp. BCO2]|nr:Macrolide export ATP-binding/permease protein MacB [Geobacillus sp. BCO2]